MKSPLNSDRLQKMMAALKSVPNGLTPIELNRICDSTRASSDISELRQNGVPIEKTWQGYSASGRRVYSYRIAA
jgi:hypothetical protein